MCGICGLIELDGRAAADRATLERMNATMTHRGPDESGLMVDGPAGLAMRRLSIIDLAGGHQPISNEDGTVTVVQNGEIYNYRELREDLARRGHAFRSMSDTEVLVHLYEERGPAFAEALRGMFAIALWDARERRLVLARDRFGIKPLYYRHVGASLSFASDLNALMQDRRMSRDIDLEALEAYLAMSWVPAPLSILREARKLPAGHLMVAERGRVTVRRYARPRPAPREALRSEPFPALAAELRDRLRDSVRAHLVADVPVGVLLSGGVDSSLLTALAAEESGERIKTFSIGFEERAFNELDKARLVAERYGTDHHELIVRPSAVDLLPRLAETFDEPFGDSSALPTYLVSELAAGEVKVALAGEGADELFGGYFAYTADRLAPVIGRPAALLRPLIERLPSSGRMRRLEDRAKRFARGAPLRPLPRHCAWMECFSDEARAELLTRRPPAGADPIAGHRARFAETEGAELLTRLQDVDLGTYLADDLLVKTDRASMAHSLETRVPFLDAAVADLAFSVPSRHHVRGLKKKRLLRAAAAPLVPESILAARKQGFSIPAAAWLRGELEPFARSVLSPTRVRAQGLFRPETITRTLDDHVSRRADNSRHLWTLLMFTLWHERVSGGATPEPRPLRSAAHGGARR